MVQSAYASPESQFPQDTTLHHILDDSKQRETFQFDLMELAGRVTKPTTPETELFYQVCYETIYGQMFEGQNGEGKVWLPYGDFTARLSDKETQEAYKSTLEQALAMVKKEQAEFGEVREALYSLGMFWYLRGAVSEP
jgi:hypothetical protein